MASSLRLSTTTLQLRCSISHNQHSLSNHFAPRHPSSRAATLSCSVRRRQRSSETSKRKNLGRKNVDEDPFEALFRQLEEDLKNDELNGEDGEDDITEEEMAQLERELAALGDDELLAALESIAGGEIDSESEEEEDRDVGNVGDEVLDEDYVEEEILLDLKDWQIERLAHVLKYGRRKTRIKDLAAELGLDRDEVIKMLHDPPRSLVLMSNALPDKPVSVISKPVEEETIETVETLLHVENFESEKTDSVHVRQSNWSARKRLTTEQVETLEQVYEQTKHPTKASITNVVHLTKLPRKRVVKWFEDKRAEEGAPENCVSYQEAAAVDTEFTS